MSPLRQRVKRGRGSLLLAALFSLQAAAPAVRARVREEVVREPSLLRLKISEPYLAFETLGDNLDISYPDGDPVRDHTLDFTPSAGLSLAGSIYHPRLLQFNGTLEQGYTWGERTYSGEEKQDREFNLTRFNASATLLAEKPYTITLFGRKNRSERNYDRFNRYQVDAEQYGAQNTFEAANWKVSLRAAHDDEQYSGTDRPGFWIQDTFDFDATRTRKTSGQTTFRYTYEDYEREDGGVGYTGTRQYAYVQDEFRFGLKDNHRLISSVSYNDAENDFLTTKSLTLREDLRMRHGTSWWSGLNLRGESRENGTADSSVYYGKAYVENQLYQSLHSTLDVEAETGTYDDNGNGEDYTRFGPGLAEHYTKKLGERHNLAIDLGLRYEQENLGSSGDSSTVLGEPVAMSAGQPTFLRMPRVDTDSIVVRDPGGSRVYIEGIDYVVEPRGDYVQIRRLVGGAIPADSTVLVDYRADSELSQDISRLERRGGIRFDFFERLLSLFAEHRGSDSTGGTSLRFQDFADNVAGIKTHYRWIDAGAEWFQRDSDSLAYDGHSLFLDLSWQFDASSLILHAGRTSTTYDDTGDTQDSETYSAQYEFRPVPRWSFQLYAANYREGGQDSNRELNTAEARAQYAFSRLSVDATYRIEQEDLDSENRDREYFLIRARRNL